MKEVPILFSAPMVQAILSGKKTQTRRIVKQQPHGFGCWVLQGIYWLFPNVNPYMKIKSRWNPGDILWVRETWYNDAVFGAPSFYYKADDSFNDQFERHKLGQVGPFKWKPSIHMPRAACRLFLKVNDVRVERLQDITEEDAIAEGVGAGFQMNSGYPDYQHIKNGVCELTQDTAVASYASLWDSINGCGSWDQNPWVWVIEFERI